MEEYKAIYRVSADVARLLIRSAPLEEILLRIGRLAVATIPSCEVAGVTLEENGKVVVRTVTDPLVETVDEYQYEIGEGPGLEASQDRKSVLIERMNEDARWPRFAQFASSHGVKSSYSIPLCQDDKVVGSLNLYSLDNSFTGADEAVGALFAEEAAVAVSQAAMVAKTRELVDNLNRALESRSRIGAAVGLIMHRDRVTLEDAFEALKVESQASNTKLREVADQHVARFEKSVAETAAQSPVVADGYLEDGSVAAES
jgi:GAF domain-containing protein